MHRHAGLAIIRAESMPAGCGQAAAEFVVSELPSAAILEIPSCVTGRGSSGAILRYWLFVDDLSRLHDEPATVVTLVLTLSDDM
jgi:hypothetical protein